MKQAGESVQDQMRAWIPSEFDSVELWQTLLSSFVGSCRAPGMQLAGPPRRSPRMGIDPNYHLFTKFLIEQ